MARGADGFCRIDTSGNLLIIRACLDANDPQFAQWATENLMAGYMPMVIFEI